MSDSLAPAIGFNWGAKKYDRVKKILKCNYIGAMLVSIAATAIMFFLAKPIASLFVETDEENLLKLSAHALKLFCIAYLIRWFTISTQSFLSAIEKPVHATIMSVAVALIFPVIMLGALWFMGLDGIWLNMFGAAVLTAVLAVVLLMHIQRAAKKRKK